MDPVLLIALSLIILGIVGIIFLEYLKIRNNRVLDFLIKVINDKNDSRENYPSYGEMVYSFWVWPLSKFKRDENADNSDA